MTAAPRWRMALVTTFYPPYHFGGDAIAVRHLAHALARRGHDVTVVHDTDGYRTLAGGDPPPAALTTAAADALDGGVRVVALRHRHAALSTLLTQQTGHPALKRRAVTRALAGRFDVIHFHNVSLVGGPGVLALGDATVKLYTAHEHWLVCPTHVLWRDGRERCERRACVRCALRQRRPPQLWRHTGAVGRGLAHVDVVLAQSEFSRDRHRAFGLRRDMDVLPPFLPDARDGVRDAGAAAQTCTVAAERPYVLFVGRLEPLKGLADVVPLFTDTDGLAGAELRIAGDGSQRAVLEALARGSAHVRFLGRLDGAALEAQYRDAVAVVVPTEGYETFGLVVIEAFRHGVPVVARRRGPLPELLEGSGAGALFDTVTELAAALTQLVVDPARRRSLGARGAAAFAARWSEGVVMPRYERLVSDAIERRRTWVPAAAPSGGSLRAAGTRGAACARS